MRHFFLFLLLFVLALGPAGAQTLTGKRVSKDFPVAHFNAIKASGVIELTLVQGNRESVTVESDEALQAYVTIASNGNTLEIATKKLNNKNIRGNWKLAVTVHFRSLEALSLSTVGNVRNEGTLQLPGLKLTISSVGNTNLKLETGKLQLDASSVGNIALSGSARQAVMRNSSVGNIRAENFKVGTLQISNTGIGNTDVNADEITGYQASMLGRVRNRGQQVKNYD